MLARRHVCGLVLALFGISALCLAELPRGGKAAQEVIQARECLREAWDERRPAERPTVVADKDWYRQADAHLDRIGTLPAEDLQDLCMEGELAPLDADILSIALFRHRNPELLDQVRKELADLFAHQHMIVPFPVRVPEHLRTAAHRLAWEYLLLRPDDAGRLEATVVTAARALKAIGDPRSLPTLEAVYVWTAQTPRFRKLRTQIMDILGEFGRDPGAKREALRSAWRCYGASTADWGDRVFPNTEKQIRLGQLEISCDQEVVKQELAEVNEYREFLELILVPEEGKAQ